MNVADLLMLLGLRRPPPPPVADGTVCEAEQVAKDLEELAKSVMRSGKVARNGYAADDGDEG